MAQITVTFEGYGEMIDFARMVAAGGEAVRRPDAKLNKEGKKAQVQELIKSFGADKLSQIPEDKYAEVMRKAGEL